MESNHENTRLFERLFQEHAGFVWRVLRRLGVQDGELEDAVQEVFIVVVSKLAEYDERGAVRAWLFTIARQVASHFRRARMRLANKEQALRVSAAATSASDPHASIEASSLVHKFLAKLEPEQAMVFYLSDVEGMSAPEISVALQLNLTTVQGRLRLARKHFEARVRTYQKATR